MATRKSYAALQNELLAIQESMEKIKNEKADLLADAFLKNDKNNYIVGTADVDLRKLATYVCNHFEELLRMSSAEYGQKKNSQKVKSSQPQVTANQSTANTGMTENRGFSGNSYYQNGSNNNQYNR